jgi:hypothetical protein
MTRPTTLDEKKARLAVLKSQCSSWLSSTDGSYEMALDDVGYYKLLREITKEEIQEEERHENLATHAEDLATFFQQTIRQTHENSQDTQPQDTQPHEETTTPDDL